MGNNAQNPVDDESDMQVTLSLDDGSEVECAILTIFELEASAYGTRSGSLSCRRPCAGCCRR